MARFRSRKSLVQLLILVLIGWGVSIFIQRSGRAGRDVGGNAAVQGILSDTSSPSSTPPAPTLTMVLFTDYRCPACKRAEPAMERAIAADGHVRVVYRDWPIFGPLSEQAARIAIAGAAQGVYRALHHRLMTENRRLDVSVLREAVERSGGDWDRVQADLRTHGVAIDRQLERNRYDAYSLGLPGTPAYLAGPILLVGATDEAGFRALFAQARKRATAATERGKRAMQTGERVDETGRLQRV